MREFITVNLGLSLITAASINVAARLRSYNTYASQVSKYGIQTPRHLQSAQTITMPLKNRVRYLRGISFLYYVQSTQSARLLVNVSMISYQYDLDDLPIWTSTRILPTNKPNANAVLVKVLSTLRDTS